MALHAEATKDGIPMTSQLYLARGIAAGMIHASTGGQDPALLRSVEIARGEARRARRGRLAR